MYWDTHFPSVKLEKEARTAILLASVLYFKKLARECDRHLSHEHKARVNDEIMLDIIQSVFQQFSYPDEEHATDS
eukprot:MONOS_13341.1-p1 / transcript=MONOS_13341.1 / gene=MONOS_13341 / organism=Monocercomonoides_exilis_PA203 / gene_product=unspecified product / transcript_product=unspecified product / location=Mono_scaffold00812:21892-22221(-) / protein_length=75 / sequence_SO=supercontig / SO=protein_coding / is_pseudo=false